MDKTYIKIRIGIPAEEQDTWVSELMELGCTGFLQEEEWVEAYKELEGQQETLPTYWENLLGNAFRVEVQTIEEENWNKKWEESIEPRQIGTFYVHPTWNTGTVPEGCTSLVIDPKMAFGTGYHETTRLLLSILPDYIQEGDVVLDMGTGTGVLAVAALKCGAKEALGVDIDPWSFENASENARLNNVEKRFEVRIGSVEALQKDEMFDVILANINRNILLDLGSSLHQRLKPGGWLLLSGLLHEDEEAISCHESYADLNKVKVVSENEWIAIASKKV
ncbi:50S ribosomal protein L11 methyltransferase [Balneolaceae bacterium ANBcel3]|nr:50S ribosomal protein L11 methyltransferase [Balneolaceae bacterium ANBcel3]